MAMKQACQFVLWMVVGSCLAAGQTAIPQAPSEDFQQVRAAIHAAPSWHVAGTRPVMVDGRPEGVAQFEMEAECPDRALIILGDDNAQIRFAVLGEEEWDSRNGSAEGPWEKMEARPAIGRFLCGHDALAGRVMRPETARSHGVTTVRGTLCRLWQLEFYDEDDARIEGTLCAGPDNLPLEIGYSDGLRLTFVDWGHTQVLSPQTSPR
ncbi:MAG TPA: hypothetical protein VE825_12875 [Terriglobales bacterium]|jgi:hypothetical protein|nr:hypothetical protein [Terriglobales bacterium]